MAAAVILTVGVFALSEAFSGALRMARYEDELMRAAYFLEAGVLVWEKTGKWQAPGEWAKPHRYEEIKDKSMRRGRLYVRLTSASRADELSLTAYRQ